MVDSFRKPVGHRTPVRRLARFLLAHPALGLGAGALMAGVIIAGMLMPVPDVEHPDLIIGADKVYHFTAFAALVFPVIATGAHRWVWFAPLAIAFGGAIELIQPYFDRSAEWLDFVANSVGVAFGVVLGRLAYRWLAARAGLARR